MASELLAGTSPVLGGAGGLPSVSSSATSSAYSGGITNGDTLFNSDFIVGGGKNGTSILWVLAGAGLVLWLILKKKKRKKKSK